MNALLTKLRQLRIDLSINEGSLKVNAPEGVMTPEILQEIRLHKETLLEYLREAAGSRKFTALAKTARQEFYPATYAQKRLFFLYQFDKTSTIYNMPQYVKITGILDKERLNKAFETVQQRHEALRTTFGLQNREVVQYIHDHSTAAPEYVEAPVDNITQLLQDFIKPFDLEQGPLLSMKVVTLPAGGQLLLTDMHHIVCDGVAQHIFLKELIAAYAGTTLAPLELQYRDFAVWQQSAPEKERTAQYRDFWLQEFAETPEALQLPADLPRPIVKKAEGAMIHFELDSNTTTALTALADHEKCTLFMVLLGIYNIFLAKVSGAEDITIGTPVAGRQHADTEGMMGMFVNTLPLRNYPTGTLTVREFLQDVKTKVLACFERQSFPFEELVDALKIVRDPSRNPLFDAMFIFQNFDHTAINVAGLNIEILPPPAATAKFDLSLEVCPAEDRLLLSFEYDKHLFAENSIRRFVTFFQRTAEAFAADPDQPLMAIEMMSEWEKRQVLYDFNDSRAELSFEDRIIDLFDRQVNATPEKTALLYAGTTLTYTQLDEQAGILATVLLEKGYRHGDIVMVLAERSPGYIAAMLAAMKLGAPYLPVDVGYPNERIHYIVTDSAAKFVIADEQLVQQKGIVFSTAVHIGFNPACTQVRTAFSDYRKTAPAACFNIIYTSGSTGEPKGVMGSERGIFNRLKWGWDHFPYTADEVACQKTSITFVDHVAEIFLPLLKGIPQVIARNEEVMQAGRLLELLRQNRVTRLTMVPSLLQVLLQEIRKAPQPPVVLKYIFSSGEALGNDLVRDCCEVLGNTQLINIYGATEVTADVTWYPVREMITEETLSALWKTGMGSTENPVLQEPHVTAPGISLEQLSGHFKNSGLNTVPVSPDVYYRQLQQQVLPFTINTASPTYIGHMTSALPEYVHDISRFISRLNQNLVKIETSKVLTFLEREAIAKLHRAFYFFSPEFYNEHVQQLNKNLGIITGGGTMANITALLAARNKALADLTGGADNSGASTWRILQENGYEDMVIIGSRLMHYSFRKAAALMGIGAGNIIYADNNEKGEMDIADLQQKIAECRNKKRLIIAVIGIAGSTERGNIDKLDEIGRITRQNRLWFHADAAWGGALIFSDRFRELLRGIEAADSITFCGHKQLYLPQGVSVLLFRDPDQLRLNAITAHYQASADTYDTGRYTIEGSRSALSLCLHATLSVLGKKGIAALVENGIEKAELFSRLISRYEGFELLSCQINIVNYRYIPAECRAAWKKGSLTSAEQEQINRVNREIQERQFFKGLTFVSKTIIRHDDGSNIQVFRVVLSNPLTMPEHLIEVLKDQLAIIAELYGENNESLPGSTDALKADEWQDGADTETVVIGKPLYNTRILILDKYGRLVPVGVYGEICVSGDCLAEGYLNRPALTAEKFTQNPYLKGERMFRTGDKGKWLPDGSIRFAGRIDHQIKLRGFRIEPAEIEQQLRLHPAVEEAVVVVKGNNEDKMLVAYFTENTPADVAALRTFLTDKLPYYMVPSHFIRLDSIPRTPNGKRNRMRLQQAALDVTMELVKPENHTETLLAQIWATVLEKDRESISVTSSFFEMGGNSFKIVQLISLMNEATGWQVSVPEMFRYASIRSLIASRKDKGTAGEKDYTSIAQQEVSGMEEAWRLFEEE